MQKIRVAIIAVLTAVICSFPCACSRTSNMVETRVAIGVILPLSGDLSDKGRDSSRGVILAIEEINAAGGIESMGGAKVEAVFADSAGDTGTGIKQVEHLINNEKVCAVIGAYQSSVTKSATLTAEKLKTPFIVEMAIADVITERGFRYTFRIAPKASDYGKVQVEFLDSLGSTSGYTVKKVALIHENTDFGTAAALAQKEALRQHGMELAAEISYVAEGVTDLHQQVNDLLASQPDAILEAAYLSDSVLIKRELSASGMDIPMVDSAGGTVSPEYVESLGVLAEGSFTVVEYSKYDESGAALNNRFKERFNVDINGDSAYAYQAVWLLKEALEKAGSADREALRRELATTDMPSGPHMILPAERLRFNKDGQNEYAPLFISQIQNGEMVPVWPSDIAVRQAWINGR